MSLEFLIAMHDFQVLGIAVNDCYPRTMRLAACDELLSRETARIMEVTEASAILAERKRKNAPPLKSEQTRFDIATGMMRQLQSVIAQNKEKSEEFCKDFEQVISLRNAGENLPEHIAPRRDPTNSTRMIMPEPEKSVPPTVTVLYRPQSPRGYRAKVRN